MVDNLLENVNQAEKILKNINFDLNDKNYLDIKQQLASTNQIGYLGFVIKLSIKNNNFNYNIAKRLTNFINKHKQLIKQLPKPLINYNNIEEIIKDLKKIKN
ncbi:MAG: hypothetical protein ACOCVF_01860 [bacterium]